MATLSLVIGDEVWTININVDSSKSGCNFLSNEIWANGDRVEIRHTLLSSIKIAKAISRSDKDLVETIRVVDDIMRIVGLRL